MIHNADVSYELLKSEADKIATIRFHEMNKINRINIQVKFAIKNGQGQGWVNIARAAGLMISSICQTQLDNHDDKFYFCDEDCTINAFADDQFLIAGTIRQALKTVT